MALPSHFLASFLANWQGNYVAIGDRNSEKPNEITALPEGIELSTSPLPRGLATAKPAKLLGFPVDKTNDVSFCSRVS